MGTANKTKITVEITVNAPIEKVWEFWNNPKHITKWNFASDDWHAPYSENDLKVGGKGKTTMAAKDGSFSFDFGFTHTKIKEFELIESTMEDGRKMSVQLLKADKEVKITETFEAESTNPIEMQKNGWQAILNNFKKYTESN